MLKVIIIIVGVLLVLASNNLWLELIGCGIVGGASAYRSRKPLMRRAT